MYTRSVFWFRRDLRLEDNNALFHALQNSSSVIPVFIFDEKILSLLKDKQDKRVNFIFNELLSLKKELKRFGSDLQIYHGEPLEIWKELIQSFHPDAVYFNKDYEPYAKARDYSIRNLLNDKGIMVFSHKDQIIFEAGELKTGKNQPYHVFTSYRKKWLKEVRDFHLRPYRISGLEKNFFQFDAGSLLINDIGFYPVETDFPGKKVNAISLEGYKENRDFPARTGTSVLSVHLRFGTISIRELSRWALANNQDYLSELIWREFFMVLMDIYPRSAKESFYSKYNDLQWENNPDFFEKWKNGETGVPLVDAGMRELNNTGLMHNRVRMITASFLTKNLHIDWRWGERYFAEKLLDYDLSANVGNWQWVAGTGVDAAPYFRIFNPIRQQERFDPDFEYIRRWIPDYKSGSYIKEIVDLKKTAEEIRACFKRLN